MDLCSSNQVHVSVEYRPQSYKVRLLKKRATQLKISIVNENRSGFYEDDIDAYRDLPVFKQSKIILKIIEGIIDGDYLIL